MQGASIFTTNTMTLLRGPLSGGNVLARHLPCHLKPINTDWILAAGGTIPEDSYDLYSQGWTQPLPQRGDFFVDETTNIPYQVFGNPMPYTAHVKARVARYGNGTAALP